MITTAQAAALAHRPRVTVLKWIARGHLKATKIGRDWIINEQDLQQFLTQPRKPGPKPKEQST